MKKSIPVIAAVCASALCFSGISAFRTVTADITDNTTAISQLYDMNFIEGFPDGNLHGDDKLSRAQFSKILSLAFPQEVPQQSKYDFSDMDKNHWAYEFVQKAANAGRINGFDDGTFRPDENIRYEQALTIICRVLNLTSHYSSYPEDYISCAIDNSLTDGVHALIGDEITREQASKIILNAINYIDNNPIDDYTYNNSSMKTSSVAAPSGGGGGGAPAGLFAVPDSAEAPAESFATPMAPYYPGTSPNEFNTEEYTASDENVFKNPVTSPLSTFSIDTDTASYSNLRRFILNGQKIPNGSVRSEELINYFDYTPAQTEADKPFGVNYTVSECPWNENNLVAMLTVSGEELKEAMPSNIVFLIDTSGSMYDKNKLPLVKQALSLLLDKLGENDRISIVTYASGTGVALEPTPATEKEKIMNVINGLHASGGTYGESGINLAYEQAEKCKIDGNNRIILCTDGDFNIGSSSAGDLEKLIEEKRQSGIFLSVLGFGMGNYKDNRMETLADKGNGNYAYIDNLREAKKVLVDEMPKTIYTIAKDVKIQVEFNPEKVSQYRLIGYENRLLNNEDFENDAKDAGELGSGSTVTVLYEIVPGNAEADSGLKYQTTDFNGSEELMTVNLRYKLPDGNESILTQYPIDGTISENTSDDFRFACAVAELGMILNDSEYKGNSSYKNIISLAAGALGEDKFGIRSEFVQLVDLLSYQDKL